MTRGKRDDLLAVNIGKGSWQDDETTVCARTKQTHGALDLGGVVDERANGLHPEGRGGSLQRP